MKLCQTTADLQEEVALARAAGKSIGLIPTMGALHEGHGSLIAAARKENELVIVSVFVNPTQFGPGEDLEAYPRTLEADCILAGKMGADIVFAPAAKEMYPSADMTWVEVTGDITKVLCGRSRPIHFRGVTTVVSKLFNLVQPDIACFGEKDFQQLALIRKMVADMGFDIEIVGVPIMRAKDGLALSSRNGYLTAEQRKIAPGLYKVLSSIADKLQAGERDLDEIITIAGQELNEKGFRADDIQIRDADTLLEVSENSKRAVILVAAWLGDARLIDNKIVELV